MQSTCTLTDKIKTKEIFLDIVKQVQLLVVQVHVCTREEEEKLEGKTYWDLTLALHLLSYKTIHPNASEQSRTMAAFMYYVLYEQITGLQKAQTGCSVEFKCEMTPFKCPITRSSQVDMAGQVKQGNLAEAWKMWQ